MKDFMINESLQERIEELIDSKITAANTVSGGSINRAAKIETDDKNTYFLKWNGSAPDDMFPKEKRGLELLASSDSGLKVPDVISSGTDSDGINFLLIEFIQEGSPHKNSAENFGRRLAKLHKNRAGNYGLDYDNYIGRLVQKNSRHDEWIDFFIEQRLAPQLKQAIDQGKLPVAVSKNFQRLYDKLPELLPEEPASLLHGDLWGGNYFFDGEGEPVIYDPAVYYGNREIELAFTHLFGGFTADFYSAYNQSFPLQPNFEERKDIYNLYPLLVHTNMFGGSYGRQVEGIVQQF